MRYSYKVTNTVTQNKTRSNQSNSQMNTETSIQLNTLALVARLLSARVTYIAPMSNPRHEFPAIFLGKAAMKVCIANSPDDYAKAFGNLLGAIGSIDLSGSWLLEEDKLAGPLEKIATYLEQIDQNPAILTNY